MDPDALVGETVSHVTWNNNTAERIDEDDGTSVTFLENLMIPLRSGVPAADLNHIKE